MSPRILILSHYFPPDLSAGSFRASALVDALLEHGPAGLSIDVLTTQPTRYGSFAIGAPAEEVRDRCRIRRIRLPPHRGGMADQAAAFWTFARAVTRLTRGSSYDLVFATSSRLMTAVLAASVARRIRSPLYLDIRDIFVDTIADVLREPMATLLKPVLNRLERWTIQSADRVNLVSPGFEPYFHSRYPGREFSCITNGIDEAFLSVSESRDSRDSAGHGPKRVVYAGNMGEGQGLHLIIPGLALRLAGRASFRLIGDGGCRRQLQEAIERAGVSNVEVIDPVPRDRLIEEYLAADVLFLHLNDYKALEKVLPSKIFEYAALRKPIWAGVAGYAARFLRDELGDGEGGAALFRPCSVDAGVNAFDRLSVASVPPRAFIEKYRRRALMREMAADVLSCVGRRPVSLGRLAQRQSQGPA